MGKVVPYGIYDLLLNKGWVSVGINNDTAEFAVNAIRTWCYSVGRVIYPKMESLLITADCGGSNGYRVRLWKRELQKLSNELKIEINVSHFPPGTSKWNKIEHRMFSFITKNWRGKPLIDRQTVIELIGNTKTKTGLEIKAVLDENFYEKGIRITDEEMEKINLEESNFHGEWNYKIKPQNTN
ncbi:Transposase family protein, DDE domain-containing [Desulfonema limicola]|uniref:Transposase family protein, DDE domain-containing n=1 Tax=Desulfonema limicola TaxID=45656 RepID=A0A975BCU1_9BACT|nr:Transposase family protein, DDE domain-containing [Desulfonema limicola]